MENEIKIMLKKVLFYCSIILSLLLVAQVIIKHPYIDIAITGFSIGIINYILNAWFTRFITQNNANAQIYFMVGFIVRLALVIGVGLLLSSKDSIQLIPYLLGYKLVYVAIFFYGFTIKTNLRVKVSERK